MTFMRNDMNVMRGVIFAGRCARGESDMASVPEASPGGDHLWAASSAALAKIYPDLPLERFTGADRGDGVENDRLTRAMMRVVSAREGGGPGDLGEETRQVVADVMFSKAAREISDKLRMNQDIELGERATRYLSDIEKEPDHLRQEFVRDSGMAGNGAFEYMNPEHERLVAVHRSPESLTPSERGIVANAVAVTSRMDGAREGVDMTSAAVRDMDARRASMLEVSRLVDRGMA